jgi:hypothetical protein
MFRVISVLGIAFLAAVALTRKTQQELPNRPQDTETNNELVDRAVASPRLYVPYQVQFSVN